VITRICKSGTLRLAAFVLLSLNSGGGAPALAQNSDESLELAWFRQIDEDSDNAISGAELDAMRTRRFLQIDLDRNRTLTPAEFMQDLYSADATLIARREKRFDMMDRNGDGAVDVVEYLRFGSVVMTLLDHDGDGLVHRSEFTGAVDIPE